MGSSLERRLAGLRRPRGIRRCGRSSIAARDPVTRSPAEQVPRGRALGLRRLGLDGEFAIQHLHEGLDVLGRQTGGFGEVVRFLRKHLTHLQQLRLPRPRILDVFQLFAQLFLEGLLLLLQLLVRRRLRWRSLGRRRCRRWRGQSLRQRGRQRGRHPRGRGRGRGRGRAAVAVAVAFARLRLGIVITMASRSLHGGNIIILLGGGGCRGIAVLGSRAVHFASSLGSVRVAVGSSSRSFGIRPRPLLRRVRGGHRIRLLREFRLRRLVPELGIADPHARHHLVAFAGLALLVVLV
mmetsp:Transcript_50547/g.143285  ORF Transcript_50547/g.143285 Transcript_50547/m.143285 type:complete len:294 (-) Transcript_50547:657-1538(-)